MNDCWLVLKENSGKVNLSMHERPVSAATDP